MLIALMSVRIDSGGFLGYEVIISIPTGPDLKSALESSVRHSAALSIYLNSVANPNPSTVSPILSYISMYPLAPSFRQLIKLLFLGKDKTLGSMLACFSLISRSI